MQQEPSLLSALEIHGWSMRGGHGEEGGGGGKVVVIVAYTCVMVVSAKKKGTNDRVEKLILHATV